MKPSKVLENQALSWLKLLHKNAQLGLVEAIYS
jgi:hypothetical protein